MMREKNLLFTCIVVLVIGTGRTEGGVFSVDDAVFGSDALTRDTAQGLDFLDVTFSVNRAYNDVASQFGAGGDFEGFRYATRLEVVTLVNNFGFTPGAQEGVAVFSDTPNVDQLSALVEMLGPTEFLSNPDRRIVTGSTFNGGGISSPYNVRIVDDLPPQENNDSVQAFGFWGYSTAYSYVGSYLVRDTSETISQVPEPASLAVFGFGALGLAGGAIRRRKQKA